MTPADARQKWADYLRLRQRPTKKCCKCPKELPNDRDNFAVNDRGRLTGTCLHCADLAKRKDAQLRKAGPARSMCPICDVHADLVIDHQAPRPTRICRACLGVVNSLRRAVRVEPALLIHRIADYARWQQGIQ